MIEIGYTKEEDKKSMDMKREFEKQLSILKNVNKFELTEQEYNYLIMWQETIRKAIKLEGEK